LKILLLILVFISTAYSTEYYESARSREVFTRHSEGKLLQELNQAEFDLGSQIYLCGFTKNHPNL
jgi:hypothetical protein